ncbi:MAG: [FeFe] hydrogenase H-cluster radical SAM maturase HydE [Candidatus Hydrogenedentota bacterium]|nr:MAG: [FeFe] hydrogenase H-cluster radical SAM maturase HydE [Candidatus Hydrogenedentota bacterium]
MEKQEILAWLKKKDENSLDELWRWADCVRRENVGDEVHLRGLIEISNYCVRQCGYCGLRFGNWSVERYRMTEHEIMARVWEAERYGYGTVVLQAGEDYGIRTDWLAGIIRRIKAETQLAVTLSLGERPEGDLEAWRGAGADRYLLRFETSDQDLYRLIHPPLPGRPSDRLATLRTLGTLGYETGGGVMIGIPGQTYSSLANDVGLFRALDLDMIGVGPYIPHPATPVGTGAWTRIIPKVEQVPNTEEMTYKVIALARIVCPEANVPATTALAAINAATGRELGLMRGANVVMPNLTPPQYRARYEIYPPKAQVSGTAASSHSHVCRRIRAIGRDIGRGRGDRVRRAGNPHFSSGLAVLQSGAKAVKWPRV